MNNRPPSRKTSQKLSGKGKVSFSSPPKKTLGPSSARLVQKLRSKGKNFFTLEDARKLYKKNRNETAKFLSDLKQREVLARIKSGTYLVLTLGQESTQLSNWPIIARELAKPDKYFISHYSAMRFHGMTTHPLTSVYITMTKRHRIKKVSHITYRFIYSKPEHFWGYCIQWATKQDKISVSDIEKTILDGLERPDLCGGLKEVVRGIWVKHKIIDFKKLVKYAKKFRTKAAVKRLGFILELLNLGDGYRSLLANIILEKKDYILLDPSNPKKGKYLKHWRIQINININELKEGIWG